MGAYRFSIYFYWQIGALLTYDKDGFIIIQIPFLKIMISTLKTAKGFNLFNLIEG